MKPNRKAGDKQRRARGKAVKNRRQERRDREDREMRDRFRPLKFWRI